MFGVKCNVYLTVFKPRLMRVIMVTGLYLNNVYRECNYNACILTTLMMNCNDNLVVIIRRV